MKKLLLLATLISAYWYWQYGTLPGGMTINFGDAPAARNAAGQPSVWLFTAKGCGESCNNAIKDLKQRGVEFEEKQLDPDNRSSKDFSLWRSFNLPELFPTMVADKQTAIGYSQAKYTQVLAKAFGGAYLSPAQQRYYQKHFNEDGSPRVVMYGTSWCPYCAKLRKALNSNQVEFTEIDMDRVSSKQEVSLAMGVGGYPTTYVGYARVDHGSDYASVMKTLQQEQAGWQQSETKPE